MKLLCKISFEEVLAQFRLENSVDSLHEVNTNTHAEELLQLTDGLLGEWSKVSLNREDLLQTVLPWHLGCGGREELVPQTGLTVKDTVEHLLSIKSQYKRHNACCWDKFRFHAETSTFSSLFLSTKPVNTDVHLFRNYHSGLLHLDGLHRMVSWELNKRLTPETEIIAYVAGNFSNH